MYVNQKVVKQRIMSSESDSFSAYPLDDFPPQVLACDFCFASVADMPLVYECDPVWLEQAHPMMMHQLHPLYPAQISMRTPQSKLAKEE